MALTDILSSLSSASSVAPPPAPPVPPDIGHSLVVPGRAGSERVLGTLEKRIGKGAFGSVWILRTASGKAIAAKLEVLGCRHPLLDIEAACYRDLVKALRREFPEAPAWCTPAGFPDAFVHAPNVSVVEPGTDPARTPEPTHSCLLIELLGASAVKVYDNAADERKPELLLLIAVDTIRALAVLHRIGRVHRDIKAENIVLGRPDTVDARRRFCLVDMGMVKHIDDSHEMKARSGMIGTEEYMSARMHEFQETTWADDLESLGYVLLDVCTQSLPWESLLNTGKSMTAKERNAAHETVAAMKKRMAAEGWTTHVERMGAPRWIARILDYAWSLHFKQLPRHEVLIEQVIGAARECGIDWSKAITGSLG
jgi:serine/threonine protein kinase